MKKTAIAAALMIASTASHGATLTAGETFDINILADGTSCFTFGNCVGNAAAAFVDQDSDALATNGSAIAGDGLAGVINVTTADDGNGGVTFSVNSFNMDTYLGTAGGAFGTWLMILLVCLVLLMHKVTLLLIQRVVWVLLSSSLVL